ncbi:hypothetical protein ACG0Z6_05050 [Roseateles sp. BYS180W]|uniref:Uncharacterized protein n=1 Tax=Roseateles rivi TaxID=3299028 RepID=A0ABW7FTF5_9BURK
MKYPYSLVVAALGAMLSANAQSNTQANGYQAPRACPVLPQLSCASLAGQTPTLLIARGQGQFSPWNYVQPIDVAERESVSVLVCNMENHSVQSKHWEGAGALIPQLVRNVGANASLNILVDNSANVNLSGRLTLGENTLQADGTLLEQTRDTHPSLIGRLVQGHMGAGANVKLEVRRSANVTLTQTGAHLHIGGGSLIDQLFSPAADNATAQQPCVDVRVDDSANVQRSAASGGQLTVGSGQLINELLDRPLNQAQVQVHMNRTANVTAQQVRIFKGELVDELVDTGEVNGDHYKLNLTDVAAIKSQELHIDDAELIDELVDGGAAHKAWFELRLERVAKVNADTQVRIHEGELVDELLDLQSLDASTVDSRLTDVGNVVTKELRITEGDLIDETLDAENIISSGVSTTLRNVANVQADVLSIWEGELIDEVVDAEKFDRSRVRVDFIGSANVDAKQVDIHQGELVDEAIDGADYLASTLTVGFDNAANVRATRLSIREGELVDEAVDIESLIQDSNITVTLQNTANVREGNLHIVDGELIDELVDVQQAQRSTLNITVGHTAVVGNPVLPGKVGVELTRGSLMDEFFDLGDKLGQLTAQLSIADSANVWAESIRFDQSQLLHEFVDAARGKSFTLNVSVSRSANTNSRQAPQLLNGSRIAADLVSVAQASEGRVTASVLQSGMTNALSPLALPRVEVTGRAAPAPAEAEEGPVAGWFSAVWRRIVQALGG